MLLILFLKHSRDNSYNYRITNRHLNTCHNAINWVNQLRVTSTPYNFAIKVSPVNLYADMDCIPM